MIEHPDQVLLGVEVGVQRRTYLDIDRCGDNGSQGCLNQLPVYGRSDYFRISVRRRLEIHGDEIDETVIQQLQLTIMQPQQQQTVTVMSVMMEQVQAVLDRL